MKITLLLASCVLLVSGIVGVSMASDTYSTLTEEESRRFETMKEEKLHEMGGYQGIAEYYSLQSQMSSLRELSPEMAIVEYGKKALGVKYKRGSHMFDLQSADCVTWTERVISFALTDSVEDAYRLQIRLRFKDGEDSVTQLNHYPIADWIPNNAWLFEDVTSTLGVETQDLEVFTDRQKKYSELMQTRKPSGNSDASQASLTGSELSVVTPYIPKAELKNVYSQLEDGDVILFIADYFSKTDGVRRPRCMHEGILYRQDDQVRVLHCIDPEASDWELNQFIWKKIIRSQFMGVKILRLKQQARTRVGKELKRSVIEAKTPLMLDRKFNTRGKLANGMQAIVTTRDAEQEVIIDDVVYGVIDMKSDESLWSLFGTKWKYVYELDVNEAFRKTFPDPDSIPVSQPGELNPEDEMYSPKERRLYFPIRLSVD